MMTFVLLSGAFVSFAFAATAECEYEVTVSNAKNLPDEDTDYLGWFGQKNYNDAYCEVIGYGVGGEDKMRSLRTRTIDESETPEWNEKFSFKDTDAECGGKYEKFIFKVYDDDSVMGSTVWGLYDPDFLGESKFIYAADIAKCDEIYAFELAMKRGDTEEGTLFAEISKSGACCVSSGDDTYKEVEEEKKVEEEYKEVEEEKKAEEEYKELEKEVEEEYKELEKEIEEVKQEEEKIKGGGKDKRRLLSFV